MKSVIQKALTISLIPAVLLGVWYEPFPFWKVLATITVAIWALEINWKFKK